MPRQPATQWHQFYELVRDRKFGFYEHGKNYLTDFEIGRYIQYGEFLNVVKQADKAPKLIITNDLMEAMPVDVIADSMCSMVEAGVLRLPYSKVMIEGKYMGFDNERVFVFCEEGVFDVGPHVYDFRAQMWSIYNDGAPRVVIHPFTIYCSFESAGADSVLLLSCPPANWLQPETASAIPHLIGEAASLEGKAAMRLLAIAFVVTNIKGVEREVIEVRSGLNKSRLAKGRHPIPSHSVLRIGHVYTRTGDKVVYNKADGRSTKVYLRRGHTRNQRYGKNWEQSRLIYIEPVLVNYKGDGDLPHPTTVLKW